MVPQQVELRFDTFDILQRNDEGPDEPYLWTFFVKLDGTVIDLFSPQNSVVTVHSPAGSHGDLKLPGGEMTGTDPPRAIPPAIGRWNTTLQQGNLLNLVIPQIAVAALVVAWEEDMFPSTAAMEEARQTLRAQLQSQLTEVVRQVVRDCLADPKHCNADVDFESEISVDKLREVVLDVLKHKMDGFITGAVLLNPLFALVGDRDEFIGYGIAGPFFLPSLLGAPDFRQDFTLDLQHGEGKELLGHYQIKGHVALTAPRQWAQPAAVRDAQRVIVIGRDPVVDKYFKAELGGGEVGPFRKIGEGQFRSGPAAVMSADGQQMQVFGLGNDEHFWRAMSTNAGKDWQVAWQQLPAGLFTSPPAAAMSDDGQQIIVVGRGKDNKHWLARSTDRGSHWIGWSPIGAGVFISGPAACCSASGQRLYVLGTGKDHRVWWALSTDGGQHFQMAWKPIGSSSTIGKLQSAPAAACSDDGQVIRVFGRNADQRFLWTGSDDGGDHWTPWQVIETGHFISSPAITMSPDGRTIHLFGIGRNMLLYRNGSSDFGKSWHDSFARVDDITTVY